MKFEFFFGESLLMFFFCNVCLFFVGMRILGTVHSRRQEDAVEQELAGSWQGDDVLMSIWWRRLIVRGTRPSLKSFVHTSDINIRKKNI